MFKVAGKGESEIFHSCSCFTVVARFSYFWTFRIAETCIHRWRERRRIDGYINHVHSDRYVPRTILWMAWTKRFLRHVHRLAPPVNMRLPSGIWHHVLTQKPIIWSVLLCISPPNPERISVVWAVIYIHIFFAIITSKQMVWWGDSIKYSWHIVKFLY